MCGPVNILYDLCLLGNGEVWHGHADILVNRSTVKIGTEDNKEDGSCEPPSKKMKTGDFENDENSTSDDETLVEVKKDAFTSKAVSQVLSQRIVNAFSEVNKNQELSSSYIPSFFASSQAIRIALYNCESDSLILSDNMKIFMYVNSEIVLDVTTVLSVWYALNFESHIDKNSKLFPKFEGVYRRSNFKEQAGKKFEVYDKKCTKPMTEAVGNKDIEFNLSFYYTPDSILPLIEESRSLLSHANP
jgi:hypothetical protein